MSEFRELNLDRSFSEEDSNTIPAGRSAYDNAHLSRASSNEKMNKDINEVRYNTRSCTDDSSISAKLNYDTYNGAIKTDSTASSISYDELIKKLESKPITMNVPKLPEAVNNRSSSDSISSNKANGGAVDYSLVFGASNSNPLFGCHNFVLPTDTAEEAAVIIDQYLDTTEGVSYEFTYYDCAWTVVHIENHVYSLFYMRLFQETQSDGRVKYHVYIKRVNGEYYNYMNFFERIRSLFYKIEESPAKSRADAPADMDNLFKGFTDSVEEDGTSIAVRVSNAFNILRNDRLSTYEKSDVIITLVELSTNESAKIFFTSELLMILLQYLKSIHNNYDLSLTATRCVITFYNISATERLSQDIIDPLLDYLLRLASNDGNIYDQEMRLKAAQSIENIVIYNDITSAKEGKNEIIYEWLQYTNLLRNKKLIQKNLKSVQNTEKTGGFIVDPMIPMNMQRTISGV